MVYTDPEPRALNPEPLKDKLKTLSPLKINFRPVGRDS